ARHRSHGRVREGTISLSCPHLLGPQQLAVRKGGSRHGLSRTREGAGVALLGTATGRSRCTPSCSLQPFGRRLKSGGQDGAVARVCVTRGYSACNRLRLVGGLWLCLSSEQ